VICPKDYRTLFGIHAWSEHQFPQPEPSYFGFGGLIMMCAPGVPAPISHGAPSEPLVERPCPLRRREGSVDDPAKVRIRDFPGSRIELPCEDVEGARFLGKC